MEWKVSIQKELRALFIVICTFRMKFFSWVQNKIAGNQRNGQPNISPQISKYHHVKQDSREEFNDWPHELLAIGTFGNGNLKENQIKESQYADEDPSSPPELSNFTPENVGKLHKELKTILPSEAEPTNLPLDSFLNFPSTVEVDHQTSTSCLSKFDKRDDEIEQAISIIIRKFKEMCTHNGKNRVRKKPLSFLLKKIFMCSNGFLTKDTLPESRMEKLLRAMLQHKIYPESASWESSTKKCIGSGSSSRTDQEDEQSSDESRWDRTDPEYIVLEI